MTTQNKPSPTTRIGSMIMDHFVMTMIAMIFFVPGMIASILNGFEVTHEQAGLDIFGGLSYVGLFGFALYFCKDCLNGRSIAKRASKLQVVENSSGKVASPIRCFIRNIFCILWPIEVFVTFVSPDRRIGDWVAGTKVVPYSPEIEQAPVNYAQIGLSLLLACGLMTLAIFPIESIKSKFGNDQVTYIESSLNEKSAHETELLLSNSLGMNLTPDIRVYDQIEESSSLKYISAILHLRENYLEDEDVFAHLRSATEEMLLSKFPVGTFVGQIKYVYQEPGSMTTRSVWLDWRE